MYWQLRIHTDERSSRIPVLCCEGSNFTLSEQAKMRFLNMSLSQWCEQRGKDSKKWFNSDFYYFCGSFNYEL